MSEAAQASRLDYEGCVRSHFDRLLATGRADYGPHPSAMWMASLDIRTGRYPEPDDHPAHIGKRVYRNIDAPRGCSLYWDQPLIVAAHALAGRSGGGDYGRAADAYVRDFLDRCVAANGLFLWGNHYYYDAFRDCVVGFHGNEPPFPCDLGTEPGDYHEIRPIPPAWETFWRVSPAKTERAIRQMLDRHVFDPVAGGFNRHADGRRGCAFLEAGGILVEAAAWLYARTADRSLLETARRIAAFSFEHRDRRTGLLENNPTVDRWDKTASTTEVGLWAGCLVRAAQLAPPCAAEWRELADAALAAWLRYGFDPAAKCYFGRLDVRTGRPILEPKTTDYQPGDHADLWEPLFPAHDYPMAAAEAGLALWRLTGKPIYREACRRWVGAIRASLPARGGRGGYAEHYGRCIHFLLGCEPVIPEDDCRSLARELADDAVLRLFAGGMFRSHPGEDRCDAVDGVGYLALALLWLATGDDPPAMGFGW